MSPSGKIVKREDFEGKLDLSAQVGRYETVEVSAPNAGSRVISKETYAASHEARKIIDDALADAKKIKKEAEALLNRVQEEMEKKKKQGFEEGREEGLAQVSELLFAAIDTKEKMFQGVESDAVKLVYDIAEKVLGTELQQRETAILDLIREALHVAVGQKIVILVNPQDYDKIKNTQTSLIQALDSSKTIQIRMDEKVKPLGCLIETEIGTIDAQLETQLGAIKKALDI